MQVSFTCTSLGCDQITSREYAASSSWGAAAHTWLRVMPFCWT